MRDWMSLPDGSICIWDECQKEITGLTADKAQQYEKDILSEHRKRSFDFFFCTPHPMNMGAFVRRTIASPGWHRHFKASTIALNSNELKWTATNTQPEKPGSGASGTVTSRTHPKEVYEWYMSTSGDTAVRKIPARVWWAIVALIVAAGMIFGAVVWAKHLYSSWTKPDPAKASSKTAATPSAPSPAGLGDNSDKKRTLTTAEYAQSFEPRIAGLAYTAPRYDQVLQVKQAPKPAACLDGVRRGTKGRVCNCYTQQATPLDVPEALCRQIAAGGIFDDTLEPVNQNQAKPLPAAVAPSPGTAVQVAAYEPPSLAAMQVRPLLDPPATHSTVERDGEILKQMRKREYIK